MKRVKNYWALLRNLYQTCFFLPNGLARLGWCINYQMNSRIVYNKKEKDKFEKIQISEFYWFNYSASEKVCDCFHCSCFKNSK